METAETEEPETVALPEPNDRFRALDYVNEDTLPLPDPVLKPLTHEQRVQLLADRYSRRVRLWHPAEGPGRRGGGGLVQPNHWA